MKIYDLLLQEIYAPDTWKQLVCNILLNRTNRTQVEKMREEFFTRWNKPEDLAHATFDEVYPVIKELGFGNRRAHSLINFSMAWITLPHDNWEQIKKFPGMGKYAEESYRIFTLGEINFEPEDKKLIHYLERIKK